MTGVCEGECFHVLCNFYIDGVMIEMNGRGPGLSVVGCPFVFTNDTTLVTESPKILHTLERCAK